MQDSEVAARVHRRRRDDAPEAVALAAGAWHAADLVRSSPDPVLGFTTEGIITEWNPAAERMYGYTPQQALGQSVELIVPPGLSADGLFARVRAGETIGGLDTQSITSTGDVVDVSISMSPIVDDVGKAIGVAAFTRDIGVRVLADERLRRSETMLTEAQELTSIGSWEWDLVTNDVFWSRELYRILGLDPDRVVPSLAAYVACIHPADRASAERDFAAVVATGASDVHTCRILGGDGVERIAQSHARATTDADGRIVRLNGTTQDVSQLVRANQRLEHANRRNEALLNSAGEGIYGIDRAGMTIFANPVAARLTGHDVDELLRCHRHDAFRHTRLDGSPYPQGGGPVAASLEDGTVHHCDADIIWRKDGTSFPVEYTSTPIFEQGVVVGAVVVFKDISARRDLERAKDAFVASISHELRTPLTSIRGYLELFADETSGPLTAQQRRFLAVVDRNTERLLRVVGDLLLVAQVDAGAIELTLEDVDVADLMRHAVEGADPHATACGLELAADVTQTPTVHADRARLGQVVDNLVSNAIKFTPAGGRVDLRCFAAGDRVVLEVADTGLGMSEREQEQLFERFYRTAAADEQAIQGTGLGLTIVKAFVEAHEGAISVTSATGAGTTFRVELPLAGPVRRAAA
jgi:PAS domain S-box-containing protein